MLDALVERRLLTVEERGGVRRIELAHDVLTRNVKASRDERHEVEAVERARSEQERPRLRPLGSASNATGCDGSRPA